MVPLAVVEKEPMRELNAQDSNGNPIPLLGMSENVELAVAMLTHVLTAAGIRVSEELEQLLVRIAGPGNNQELVQSLLSNGSWNDVPFWEPNRLPPEIADLIQDFARGFLLAGLLPASSGGVRQVVKLAFHWRTQLPRGIRATAARVGASIRMTYREIELPMTAPSDTRSYHLEFQTPPELDCIRLALPDAGGRGSGKVDLSGKAVAHVHGTFDIPPNDVARARLAVPGRGLWTYAVLATVVTATTLWLCILLPGATETLKKSSEGAAAVFLALPAVLIGIAAGRRESALAAWMLTPLRAAMLTCSVVLLVLGWSLIGKLQESWYSVLWVGSAVAMSVQLIAVGGPALVRGFSRTGGRVGTDETREADDGAQ